MKTKTLHLKMVILLITLMSALGANAQIAYACYTSDNTTLTFYYDNLRNSRLTTGKTYVLNTGTNDPDWYTDGTNVSVTKVIFHSSFAEARPTTTYGWFSNMVNLKTVEGISNLNTSEVTNMAWMFIYCYELTDLDLSYFNTSKVTTMEGMFYECLKLQTIYAGSGWTTNAVTESDDMFFNCIKLEGDQGTKYDEDYVDKTYAHIDGGKNKPGYFTAPPEAYACYTPGNTTLTFYYDYQRSTRPGTTYDLNTGSNEPGWYIDGTRYDVTKVVFHSSFAGARPTTTNSWFYEMQNLQSIEGMSYLNTSEVTDMAWMFNDCSNLTALDLSHFNTAKVTNMVRMFSYCTELTSLDLGSFNTRLVTKMNYMFLSCTNLRTIYVGNRWSTDDVMNSESMFHDCISLVGGKGTTYNANHVDKEYAHIDGGPSDPGYFTTSPEVYVWYSPSNTTLTFCYDNLRASREGKTYDLNTDRLYPDWKDDHTNNSVTKVVFLSSFAEARPTTTFDWFYYMEHLETIEGMRYLNTSEVTDMSWMFFDCPKLTGLNLSFFNTAKVTNMRHMFDDCTGLTSLDLSSFNTAKVTNMEEMFYECLNLQTIYVGDDWTTNAVTSSSDMFYNCTSLVGGQGTKYDASHRNKAYAHIDGGKSNPGYFTVPPAGITTDIENVQRDAVKGQRDAVKVQSEEWFTIDGQKLSGKPTKKGVYIHNGKVVIK